MLNILRIAVMFGALAGSFWVAESYRSFGFSAYSAVLTLILSFLLDFRRLKTEAPFFVGHGNKINGGLAFFSAAATGLIRAVLVGLIALFLFSVSVEQTVFAEGSNLRTGILDTYLDKTESHDELTRFVFFGLVLFFTVIGIRLNRMTVGRTHRWAMFRSVWAFSLIFAITMGIVQNLETQNSKARIFQTGENAFRIDILKQEFDLIAKILGEAAVKAGDSRICEPLQDSLEQAEIEADKLRSKLEDLDPERNFFRIPTNQEWKDTNEALNKIEKKIRGLKHEQKDSDCDRTQHDVAVASLLSLSVLDELASTKTIAVLKRVDFVSTSDDEDRETLMTSLISVIFSSTIIQGIVMGTYVAFLLTIWNFGRRVGYATDAETEFDGSSLSTTVIQANQFEHSSYSKHCERMWL